jgi:hypothetical protein
MVTWSCPACPQVRYKTMLKTKGGWLVDVAVTLDNRETVHRVIVGEAKPLGCTYHWLCAAPNCGNYQVGTNMPSAL